MPGIGLVVRAVGLVLLIIPLGALAQNDPILIDDTKNIEDVIKSLQGPGTEITNVTFSVPGNLKALGYFEDTGGILGLKKGLLMTTEAAALAVGPNNLIGQLSKEHTVAIDDPDLATITPGAFFDIATVEFDLKTTHPKFSFSYIFGSEEYPEYVGEIFNDAFGLFISGPGIDGKENLARLKDGSPISINSINPFVNNDQFVSNGLGLTPDINYYLQYDGYTRKQVASAILVPNETYHVKIIIADNNDNNYDSGVFLEQESFVSEIPYEVSISFETEGLNFCVEGCNSGFIIIARDEQNAQDPLILEFALAGSAKNGTDYNLVQEGPLTLAAGELRSIIQIKASADGETEGFENVVARFTNPIAGTTNTAELAIRDELTFTMNDETICYDNTTSINQTPQPGFLFNWADQQGLSCLQCSSPTIKLLQAATFSAEVTEIVSGCKANTELTVNVDRVDPSFDAVSICENVQVALNPDPAPGYEYFWSDNPALSCTNCPSPFVQLRRDASFPVDVRHRVTGCIGHGQLDVTVKKVSYNIPGVTTCRNEPVIVNPLAVAGPYQFQWTPDVRLSCLICTSPAVTTDSDVLLHVRVTDTGLGCDTQLAVPVQVVKINFPVVQQEICQNTLSSLHVNDHAGYSFVWLADDNLSCLECSSPDVTLDDDTNFLLKVTENASGCSEPLLLPVHVKKIAAHFSYEVTDQYSSVIASFSNQSQGANEFLWSFGDGQTSSDFEPVHDYEPKGETLEVQLTAINSEGLYCESTFTNTIFVHEPVFIPNVITPNDDAYNQFFEIKGIESGIWRLVIFNTWGSQVYNSPAYQNNWSAENASSGIYYYELQNPHDKKAFKGWIHVLR